MPIFSNSLPLALVLIASLITLCASQDGFETFPTGSYKLHGAERVDWGAAWQVCRGEGAHLAIINNDTEAFILSGLFARVTASYSKYCHLGFHDMFVEGTFVTIFGEDLEDAGYAKWDVGEPNNNFNEDCGSMTHGALLNDEDCGKSAVFICEKEIA